jgi:hypothetical protein
MKAGLDSPLKVNYYGKIHRISHGLWSYHITKHGRFFLSHIYHPIPVSLEGVALEYTMW